MGVLGLRWKTRSGTRARACVAEVVFLAHVLKYPTQYFKPPQRFRVPRRAEGALVTVNRSRKATGGYPSIKHLVNHTFAL